MADHPAMANSTLQPAPKRTPLKSRQSLGLVEKYKESKTKPPSYKYNVTGTPMRLPVPACDAQPRQMRVRKLTKFDILDKENAGPSYPAAIAH